MCPSTVIDHGEQPMKMLTEVMIRSIKSVMPFTIVTGGEGVNS